MAGVLPAIWNGWELWEGDEVTQQFRLLHDDGSPEDLSLTPIGAAQIRKSYDDAMPMCVFVVTVPDQSVAENLGIIELHLTMDEADKLVAGPAFWDVQLTKSDNTGRRTRLAGRLKIKNQATYG